MLVLEWKERAFIEKVNSRCFCWFPAAILVHQNGTPIWRLHTKLYKGAWNVSANNSETVGHKDLGFGRIIYVLVFYNILFSWLLPLDGFQFIFFCAVFIAWQWKRRIKHLHSDKVNSWQRTVVWGQVPGGGGSDFNWQGWSNGGKKSEPKKKSLGLQTKLKKIPRPKFNPQKIPCWISEPQKFPESIKWYNTKNRDISF